jgi:O-antigen ligase
MQNKIFNTLAISTGLILASQIVFAGAFSFTNNLSIIILSLFVLSLSHFLMSGVYRPRGKDYDPMRLLGLAVIASLPMLAIIFVASHLYPFIVGKAFVFRFVAIFGLISFLYLVFARKSVNLKMSLFTIAFVAFTGIIGVANLFSLDIYKSFWSNYERMEGYINLLSMLSIVLVAAVVQIRESEWVRIFKIHIYISTFIAFIGMMQYMTGLFKWTKMSGLPFMDVCLKNSSCKIDATMGNSIYLAIYAGLTFWLILYAIFSNSKINLNQNIFKIVLNVLKSQYLLVILAILNLTVVYLTGGRGVMLGTFAGLVMIPVTYFWLNGNKKALLATFIAGFVFVFAFAGFIYNAKSHPEYSKLSIVQRFTNTNTLFARWNVWQIAVESFTQKPVLGWGQESFIHAFNQNFNPNMHGQETFFDQPHNTYLGWLVSGGILGFLAYLAVLLSAFYSSVRNYRVNKKSENNNNLKIAVITGLYTTYFIHIFFVFDNLLSILLFIVITLYFTRDMVYKELVISKINVKYAKSLLISLYVLGSLAIYYSILRPSLANITIIESMQKSARAQAEYETIDNAINKTKEYYEKALYYNTFGNYEINEYYVQQGFDFVRNYGLIINQNKDQRSITALTDFLDSAMQKMQTQSALAPYDHRAMFSLGLYYLNLRKTDLAVTTLENAVKLAPKKQFALLYLAKAYLAKGDIENGIKTYEYAISLTKPSISGYNDMSIEYINVLLTNGGSYEISDAALNAIWRLNPTVNTDQLNAFMPKILQVYETAKNIKSFEARMLSARSIDSTNENLILWQSALYYHLKDTIKSQQIILQLPLDRQSVIDDFITKTKPATTTPLAK